MAWSTALAATCWWTWNSRHETTSWKKLQKLRHSQRRNRKAPPESENLQKLWKLLKVGWRNFRDHGNSSLIVKACAWCPRPSTYLSCTSLINCFLLKFYQYLVYTCNLILTHVTTCSPIKRRSIQSVCQTKWERIFYEVWLGHWPMVSFEKEQD